MESKIDYCKRLMRKVWILQANLLDSERTEFGKYVDMLGEHEDRPIVSNEPCLCEKRGDVIQIEDKKYCCDCFHRIK